MAKTAKSAKARPTTKTTKAKTTANKAASKPVSTSIDLDPIARAIDKGDGAAALTAALAAWRAARAPALADLIDTLSSRISGPPVTTEIEWTRLAATKDAVALGGLLAGIRELPASFLPSVALRLAAFDDPRIATAAGDWALDPPTQSSSNYPFWTKLLDHVTALGDTRVIAPFAKRVKMAPEARQDRPANKNAKPSQFWGKFYAALTKVNAKLGALEPPTVDKAAIAKLATKAKSLTGKAAAGSQAKAGSRVTAGSAAKAAGSPLARAVALASTGDVRGAIDAMLEAWRDKRAPELADLIDRASRMLPSYDRAVPLGDKAGHAAWKAAYAEDPIANLPLLLHNVNVGGSSAAIEHVAELAMLPDDPRISVRLAELARGLHISPQKTAYWKSVWGLIAQIRDVRVCGPLRRGFKDFSGTYYDHHRSGKRIAGPFVLAEPPPSPLDLADHKALNQLATALGTLEAKADGQERALIADIVANWADDGPRLVYADWLTEREHPRGELIVLSCKKDPNASEQQRLKAFSGWRTHGQSILGPITDLESKLERGLPDSLLIDYKSCTLTLRRLAGDPLLATVASIDHQVDGYEGMGHPDAIDLARVMNDPTATRLTTVTNVPEDAAGQLATEIEPLVPRWKRVGRTFTRR